MFRSDDSYVYIPAFRRILFSAVALPALAYLIAWSLRWFFGLFTDETGGLERSMDFALSTVSTYAVLNFVSVLINKQNFTISISESSVSGPSSASLWASSKTITFQELDSEKLLQRTLGEKLGFEKHIWGKDGQKVVISRFFFSREQEQEIIQRLLFASNKMMV